MKKLIQLTMLLSAFNVYAGGGPWEDGDEGSIQSTSKNLVVSSAQEQQITMTIGKLHELMNNRIATPGFRLRFYAGGDFAYQDPELLPNIIGNFIEKKMLEKDTKLEQTSDNKWVLSQLIEVRNDTWKKLVLYVSLIPIN
jgi:hypothetical protein